MPNVPLFLFGCIGSRLALAYVAAVASPHVLKAVAVLTGAIALGFMTIFVGGLRPTGIETGGKPIWWNSLRPLHATLYAATAYAAWNGRGDIAWKILVADAAIGLGSFIAHHYSSRA